MSGKNDIGGVPKEVVIFACIIFLGPPALVSNGYNLLVSIALTGAAAFLYLVAIVVKLLRPKA